MEEPKDKIKDWITLIDEQSDDNMLECIEGDIRGEQDYFEELVRMYDDLIEKIETKRDALQKDGE